MSAQAEIRNKKILSMEIGELGVGRPDFGGRWPSGEALGKKKAPQPRCIEGQKIEAKSVLHIGFTTVKCVYKGNLCFLPNGAIHHTHFSPAFDCTLVNR